jgi:uncharacterized membrane protein
LAEHAITHVRAREALLTEARLVCEEICYVLGLLTDVCALILAIFVDILELFERFDDIDVISEVDNDVF